MGTTTITAETEDGGFKVTCSVNITTGINESYVKNISVAPNPTNFTATLTFDVEQAGKLKITLLDLSGKELLGFHNSYETDGTFTKTFSLEQLPSGTYFIKIKYNSKVQIEKIIKE